MQFRFSLYDKERNDNQVLGYCEIDDYDIAFKVFEYMKKAESEFCVQINDTGLVDSECDYYIVRDVYFVCSSNLIPLDEQILPHFVVSLEEAF